MMEGEKPISVGQGACRVEMGMFQQRRRWCRARLDLFVLLWALCPKSRRSQTSTIGASRGAANWKLLDLANMSTRF
ncbi:hypothetical protein PAPYR_4234 [Paratrimastix pyriformis]|uniref:Uncharacterized protein n=1 Tax=Paratrimastix pyriformis TaxID=342808 RepID=A0ABQ8UR46_9EUKA|nr:hypothetical protein PAPYR_4234 [Paratrimastix pyriformis]